MKNIPKYEHVCYVRDGPDKGEIVTASVEYDQIGETCPICDEKFATLDEIVSHIYEYLIDS